jgi:hypothetical protein
VLCRAQHIQILACLENLQTWKGLVKHTDVVFQVENKIGNRGGTISFAISVLCHHFLERSSRLFEAGVDLTVKQAGPATAKSPPPQGVKLNMAV